MTIIRSTLCLTSLVFLVGCDPLTLTALGVGAGAGINHTMNGYTYHTFSEPLPRVKQAALVALGRMSIKVESTEKDGVIETINAKSAGRSVELELEVISPKATRLRSIARKNALVMDSATAEEVIAQTRRALAGA